MGSDVLKMNFPDTSVTTSPFLQNMFLLLSQKWQPSFKSSRGLQDSGERENMQVTVTQGFHVAIRNTQRSQGNQRKQDGFPCG